MPKLKEKKVINSISQAFPKMSALQPTTTFNSYDCENAEYIIEIKCRNKRYDSWILEKSKYDSNIPKSKELGKQFIYIVEFEGDCYAWNISKMDSENYDFQWEEVGMPATTEFSNRSFKNKEVGYVYEKDALHFKVL